ncbi:MAG: phosphoglycerate dehydrogenase [Planctomycetota bacterium]
MAVTSPFSFPRDQLRVVLFENIHASAATVFAAQGYTNVEAFDASPPQDELRKIVETAHVVGIRSRTTLDAATLEPARKLFAIGCFCIGTNQVDLDFAAQRGVPVFNAPHSNTRSVAELVAGLTIMLQRDTFRKSDLVHKGSWPKTAQGSREVRGKTLGIVGYGHIGSQVSVLAEGLGMRILFYDIVPKLPLGNAEPVDSLKELLQAADVVTLHVPQTPETTGMMNAARLKQMQPGSFLINTSRGVVVDQEALAAALEDGHLAGAAVDVFPEEPRAKDAALESPLRGRRNVILTPHVAGSTMEAQAKIGIEVANKLTSYSDRGSTVGSVNFPQLTLAPHENAHRILHIHENVPGVLNQINHAIAEENINVSAQHPETRNGIGYVVLDIEKVASKRLLERLKQVEGTIRARILY